MTNELQKISDEIEASEREFRPMNLNRAGMSDDLAVAAARAVGFAAGVEAAAKVAIAKRHAPFDRANICDAIATAIRALVPAAAERDAGGDDVANLRKWADVLDIPSGPFVNEDLRHAATEIDTLRALVAQYRAALEPFARYADKIADWGDCAPLTVIGATRFPEDHPSVGDLRRARDIITLSPKVGEIGEEEAAQAAGWAICKLADGGGPGICDLEKCVCGAEGMAGAKAVLALLRGAP